MFSVALSVGGPRGLASRVYLKESANATSAAASYAASRPAVFGLSSSPDESEEAILRPSKTKKTIGARRGKNKLGNQALRGKSEEPFSCSVFRVP